MKATLSILGLYRWDQTILDDLQIPAQLDRDALIHELLLQCAEFEVLYPDAEVMKQAIKFWSMTMLPIWQRLYDTTVLKYDPISNYDRHEEWTDSKTGSSTGSESTTGSASSTGSGTSSDTTTGARTGFNTADGMRNATQTVNAGSTNDSATSSNSGTTESENSSQEDSTHKGRMWGNIGVTTSQQMIQSERDIAVFNIYSRIIHDFEDRFCIMIY